MIVFRNVSHYHPGQRLRQPIVLDASFAIDDRDRVGILAAAGTGKSSLARLFCGIDTPDEGAILTTGRCSWPLGFAGFFHPNLTVNENLVSIARLSGQNPDYLRSFCQSFCGIDGLLALRMHDLSPSQRALLGYATTIATPVDHLIADETITVGNALMREKCEGLLSQRLKHGGLILISKNAKPIRQFCDRYFVLIGNQLEECADIDAADDALTLFNEKQEKEALDHV